MNEDIAIPLIVFSFILTLVWMILNYFKWRHKEKQHAGDNSLRTSELKALMREAVEEANAPLLNRMEELEGELRMERTPRLVPAQEERVREASYEDAAKEAADRARRDVT